MEYKYKRLSTFASHEDRVGGLDNQVYTGLGGKLLVCSRVREVKVEGYICPSAVNSKVSRCYCRYFLHLK